MQAIPGRVRTTLGMRSWRALGPTLGIVLLAAGVAKAQPQLARPTDLIDLALQWARGSYRSPLVCEFGGVPRRGFRRVKIASVRREAIPRVDRITFFDLKAEDASRCFTELGEEEPNLTGTLSVTLAAASRPDTASHDFRVALRERRGFTFKIVSGRLRIGPVAGPPEATREVDFAGGKAALHHLEPGSDAARLLAEFPAPRKLRLALHARDGTSLRLHLVDFGSR